MEFCIFKILSRLILKLECSDFFQFEALGLKNANILEQEGAAAPLALLIQHNVLYRTAFSASSGA